MLRLIQSNDMDVLSAHLIESLRHDSAPDLVPDTIIIPSLGLARHLQFRIAETLGICANLRFAFPAQFLWRLFAQVLPDVPADSPFDGDRMCLRLFGLLAELPDDADHAPLHAWLRARDSHGRLELAERIARLFEQYLIYRPDWLEAWGRGRASGIASTEVERWQMRLWRALLAAERVSALEHPREPVFAELERLAARGEDPARLLPHRLRVIGVPTLPPLYLDTLLRLSRYMPVDCYALNPCEHYWADVVSERHLARLKLAGDERAALSDVGHPLLASWGRQTQEQLALLAALDESGGVQTANVFIEPGDATLLARLRASMLHLDPAQCATPPAADDHSLRIHAAHGAVRQLEVLHDELLALFARMPDLGAQDILVMTPDLDAMSAAIDAVFGAAPEERRIPYRITGRSPVQSSMLLRAFDALLALEHSRFERDAMLDLMQLPPIARRFDLEPADIELLQDWLSDTGVRWGRDADHRAALGLPPDSAHSWADGLSRLLLGYAMPGDATQPLFADVLPYADIEGSAALSVGKLAAALACFAGFADALRSPQSLPQWSERLMRLLADATEPGSEDEAELRLLRDAIGHLATDAREAELTEAVPFRIARSLLQQRLERTAPGGVPSGRVTFTGIGPLRGLSCRVIVMFGMDEGAFPRQMSPLEFDLMARHPRLGDRARRDDDRAAFLDAIACARDAFWLLYTGRSPRDNTELQPSVLIAELLDWLSRQWNEKTDETRARLLREHPLQAFNPARFLAAAPLSHARELLPVAQRLLQDAASKPDSRALLQAPLPAPADEDLAQLTLAQLGAVLRHPVRAFLVERLGVRLSRAESAEHEEPFTTDRYTLDALADEWLQRRLDGASNDAAAAVLAHQQSLPHGVPGQWALHEARQRGQSVHARWQAPPPTPDAHRELVFSAHGSTLTATLPAWTAQGLRHVSVADYGISTLLPLWLEHLLACALLTPAESQHLTGRLLYTLPPLAAATAREYLADLILLWRQAQCWPLAAPRKSAWKYLLHENSLSAAEEAWLGNQKVAGEGADAWHVQFYGGLRMALPDGFEAAATRLYGPLLAHLPEALLSALRSGK